MIEIREVLYRYQRGIKKRAISKSLGIARNTVRDIINIAMNHGLNTASSEEGLNEVSNKVFEKRSRSLIKAGSCTDILKRYDEMIKQWREIPYMTTRQILRLLNKEGVEISETSLRRYLKSCFVSEVSRTVRMPTVAGEQAQVDFGYIGKLYDKGSGRLRKAYAFVMTLSHSRYRFVKFVFKQDSNNWINCHINALEFFGGVPKTVVIDNLKSGITGADNYDPIINRSYGELERHYGFVVDPTKIKSPKHKGKVERSILIVKQQLIAGHNYADINEANERAIKWCRHEISQSVCRSIGKKPWQVFIEEERQALLSLPLTRYQQPQWHLIKVHHDNHLVIEGSFYSVPCAYLGKQVIARCSETLVQIFYQEQLIKVHNRAKNKGSWVTDMKDYPTSAQAFLLVDKQQYLEQAMLIGKATHEFCGKILSSPTLISKRKAGAVLRLATKYSAQRLEAACQRALSHGNFTYKCVERILKNSLEKINSEIKESVKLPIPGAYLRNPMEFSNYIQGGDQWKSIH